MKSLFIGGVMGHPIHHSLSPEIFKFLSEKLQRSVVYRKMDIPPDELKSVVQTLKRLPFVNGWNVTIPHKESIAKILDVLSPECESSGAVNVVKVSNQSLYGFNTDIQGVLDTFREHRWKVAGKSAMLFGAGGASAAVGIALGQMGAGQVWIVNRTLSRAKRMSRLLQKQYPKTIFKFLSLKQANRLTEPVSFYLNATPLGMAGFSDQSLLPAEPTPGAFVFDLVYRPEVTPFIRSARRKGLKAINGLDMLCWQALAAWEIWLGKISKKKEIKKSLKAHLIKKVRL